MKAEEKPANWFGIPREEIDWFPMIDYKKCIGCLACVGKCTHGVFSEEGGNPEVIRPKNCVVGCTGCQNVCSQHAISHPPRDYLEKLSKRKDFTAGCSCGGK